MEAAAAEEETETAAVRWEAAAEEEETETAAV